MGRFPLLPTETKVESGTSQSKSGASLNVSNSGKCLGSPRCGEGKTGRDRETSEKREQGKYGGRDEGCEALGQLGQDDPASG